VLVHVPLLIEILVLDIHVVPDRKDPSPLNGRSAGRHTISLKEVQANRLVSPP
jgi:hypothetical protein